MFPQRLQYRGSEKTTEEAAAPPVDASCFAGQPVIFKMRLCQAHFLAPKALQAVRNNSESGGTEGEIEKQLSNQRAKYIYEMVKPEIEEEPFAGGAKSR